MKILKQYFPATKSCVAVDCQKKGSAY